jgi:GT2 family glycosyltransferase
MSRLSVYIIVLTWNGWRDTRECLRSLTPVIDDGMRVLVVDNGSTDGTPDKAREAFPRVEVIENGRNLGFPGGNNVGIRHALDEGADHIILLNNDTVVDRGFARELVAVAERDPEIGMVTSKIYFHDRPDVLWFAGGDFSTLTGRSRHAGFGEVDRGQFDEVEEIGRPCGCSLLVTRPFLEEVGLLDEDLFLYGEEIDWVLRARRRGYKCLLAPRSKVWHKWAAGTGGGRSGNHLYYGVRNMLLVLRRHAPYRFAPLSWVRVALVTSVFAASLFTMGIDKRNGLANIMAGVRDYLRGSFGGRSVPGSISRSERKAL